MLQQVSIKYNQLKEQNYKQHQIIIALQNQTGNNWRYTDSYIDGLELQIKSLKLENTKVQQQFNQYKQKMIKNGQKQENKQNKHATKANGHNGQGIMDYNYKSWKAQDIVNWIVNLDRDELLRYEDMLLENLIKHKIHGIHLPFIKLADLKLWGITNPKRNSFIYQALREGWGPQN